MVCYVKQARIYEMVALPKTKMSVEEYLAMERDSQEKHEYLDGEIYLMSGGTGNHSFIAANTVASLHAVLRKSPCMVGTSDLRVQVNGTGLYTYPDISVVCDPPLWTDNRHDTLLNPVLLIEVLSPSTESYDRGRKFQHYRALESLQEYVLIAQDQARIERYLRQPDGQWLYADATGMDASIELASIGCTLALADVYDKINFEESDVTPIPEEKR
jgi:Uma2 family endonuclease